MSPALFLVLVVLATTVVACLLGLWRVRWYRKPHEGNWKEWDD